MIALTVRYFNQMKNLMPSIAELSVAEVLEQCRGQRRADQDIGPVSRALKT